MFVFEHKIQMKPVSQIKKKKIVTYMADQGLNQLNTMILHKTCFLKKVNQMK